MKNEDQAQQLFVPDKLKIGFQNREGTYNGKLAYVIFYDKKGELKKEKSWEDWRDKKINPQEVNNEPTEGFVLNKKVGGYKSHWNFRDAHVRVYDPRGFEFEISVPNLLFILRETDCSRGKGLEGKFVYAWDKQELVLLPVGSQDYKNSMNFTNLQDKSVHAKNLVEGASYTTKKQEILTYVGKFDYYFMLEMQYDFSNRYELVPKTKADAKGNMKVYVFHDGKNFVFLKELKTIAIRNGDSIHPNYANLVDNYNKSAHGSKPAKLFLKEVAESKKKEGAYYRHYDDPWYIEESEGVFIEMRTHYENRWDNGKYVRGNITGISPQYKYYINDKGVFVREPVSRNKDYLVEIAKPTKLRLFVEMENDGSQVRVDKPHYDCNRYNSSCTNVFVKDI